MLCLHYRCTYLVDVTCKFRVRTYVCMGWYFMYVVRLKSEEVSRDDPVWEEAIGAPFSC